MKCIYNKKNYCILIYEEANNKKYKYMVVNKSKIFKDGHTHVKSFKIAKYIVQYCIDGKPPKNIKVNLDTRLLESISRVCSNKYKNKIELELFKRQQKDITKR